jgi:lactoylglutathione lyase
MAVVQFLYVSLCVNELERSVQFYRDVLGFKLAGEYAHSAVASAGVRSRDEEDFRCAMLGRDGMRLELIEFIAGSRGPASAPPDTVGLAHLALAVDDLAATLQSLRDRGVTVLDATRTEHAAGVASCAIRDPDDLVIHLFQRPVGVAAPWDELD